MFLKNCTLTANLTNLTELGDGEARILSKDGKILTTTTSKTEKVIRIAVGKGNGSYEISQEIVASQIKGLSCTKYTQLTEAKHIFGDNGTGAKKLTLKVGKEYKYYGEYSTLGDGKYMLQLDHKVTSIDEKPVDVLVDMAYQLGNKEVLFNDTLRMYFVSSSVTISSIADLSLKFTKGSTYVSGVSVTGLALGDFIKVNSKLYQINDLDETNKWLTLSTPFVDSTRTVVAVDTITMATLIGADSDKIGLVVEAVTNLYDPMYSDTVKASPLNTVVKFDKGEFTFNMGKAASGTYEHAGRIEVYSFDSFVNGEASETAKNRKLRKYLADHGYSHISLFIEHEQKGDFSSARYNKEMNIFLDRGLTTDILANAAGSGFGTNIQTGTGLSGVVAYSFLNVLNGFLTGNGIVAETANTVSNGGKEITAGTTFNTGIDV